MPQSTNNQPQTYVEPNQGDEVMQKLFG